MPRARLISPEFWTSEAVIDCAPMARLLLLGLSSFADDFGVLPLRPRTLRLQVFPGDAIDDEAMRAMIEELAGRGLVRRYMVDGVEYLSIVDWEIQQHVAKRARRRYPAFPSPRTCGRAIAYGIGTSRPHAEEAGGICDSPGSAGEVDATPDDSKPVQSPLSEAENAAPDEAADAAWHAAVEGAVRRAWGADVPADVALHAARWRAEGRDLARDVLPAIVRVVGVAVEFNRPFRLEEVTWAMAGAPTANHNNRAM